MHTAVFLLFVLSLFFPTSSFSQQPPLSIDITSPLSGATVPTGRLLVRGTLQTGGADVGVTVNGVRAAVKDDAFAIMVPVAPEVTSLTAVVVADLNADGFQDLAVSNWYSGDVVVHLGNGNGTFKAPLFYTAGWRAGSLALADVNGDGKPDLVVANEWSSDVSILLHR